MSKMTIEELLAGTLDVGKLTHEDIDAFAADLGVEVSGEKRDKLNQLCAALTQNGPEDGTGPVDAEEAGIPTALQRRGLPRQKRIKRRAAQLPKDAPAALKRRWAE